MEEPTKPEESKESAIQEHKEMPASDEKSFDRSKGKLSWKAFFIGLIIVIVIDLGIYYLLTTEADLKIFNMQQTNKATPSAQLLSPSPTQIKQAK